MLQEQHCTACVPRLATDSSDEQGCILLLADQTGSDLRELDVEGTTFDPTTGVVKGLTALDRNLEVEFTTVLTHILPLQKATADMVGKYLVII